MKIVTVENELEFNNLKSLYKTIYLQFSATWCGPCNIITPIVKEHVKDLDLLDSVYVYCDIDEFDTIAEHLEINVIPSFCKYDVLTNSYSSIIQSSDMDEVKKLFN